MEQSLVTAWVLMLALKAIWLFVIPAILAVAAVKLWHAVPRWIPTVFVATAVVGVMAGVPPLLIHLHTLSVQQYGRVAIPIAVASGIVRLLFAVACLALAVTMKRMNASASR
jgi:hypothetical protein